MSENIFPICENCEGTMGPRGYNKKRDKRVYTCRICGSSKSIPLNEADEELIVDNVRLAKKTQRYQDTNRVERKSFREHARVENALEALFTDLRDVIKNNKFPPFDKVRPTSPQTMIIHLTDLHLNELVNTKGNRYDFKIASKRLYKFAQRAIQHIITHGINNLTIALTGDLLNSDRRLDEILTMSTNRAKAVFLGVRLLSSFINHIREYADVSVVSVTGNESRIKDEYGFNDKLASDNFDFIIYETMKLLFEDVKNVTFISGDTLEKVINVNGVNFLLDHGNSMGKMDYNQISKVISKWSKRNVKVDYILAGHLHDVKINSALLRSGSLVGENDYSDKALNLFSKASQNLVFVGKLGEVDTMSVDLQRVDDDSPMYPIDEHLESYNAKSLDKTRSQTTVFEVRV